MRADPAIQFEPIAPPPQREPGWLEKALQAVFDFLTDLLAPLGEPLANAWPVLRWLLLGALVLFVLVLAWRVLGPLARRNPFAHDEPAEDAEWQPDEAESLALLEDAEKLAQQGRFERAVRLLLQRSVGQIAAARPGLVEPSSTARELAVLPALPDRARAAFATIAGRVERSAFALRALDSSDWQAARDAYADFALTPIGRQ